AYQEVCPLRLGELWAIPIMLRLALLENLRRVVGSIASGRRDRERAAYWVDEMIRIATSEPGRLVLVLADMIEEGPPLTEAFVAELAARLQRQGAGLDLAVSWLEQRLADHGLTIEHVFHLASQSQAADQVSISNSIGSLRFLGVTDWRDFVEAMSQVEAVLSAEPEGVYRTMDFATRDRYRHAVEAIARRSPKSEREVAAAAVTLARDAGVHIGTFLIGRERKRLELAVQMRCSFGQHLSRAFERARPFVYGGAIASLTVLITLGLALLAPSAGHAAPPTGWLVLAVALVALCASQFAVALVHTAATLTVGPQLLPRLDFSEGIPPEHKTVVAVPTMLSDRQEIEAIVEKLEVRFLANRDPNLAFALLGDLRDAASETLVEDEALLAQASALVMALNEKHGPSFHLFVRARTWNPSGGVWMGRERKRGKLEDFNATLRGDPCFATVVGPFERLADTRYVIALDSDTSLPRDAARLLAATLGHPLNRPVFDPAVGRVTTGYGILQPRVGVSMASTLASRFARTFAGEPGIDPYTRAVSDVFQDLFDEGSFIGKGIYDIDVVRRAVADRFPDNRVLSHDLLEGAYARSGLVSDVILVEDFPAAHAAEVSRRARWIRGDWQIAAWLGRRARGPRAASTTRFLGCRAGRSSTTSAAAWSRSPS
ncbi:MAG: cyclic beta 1-2 glucan synthetase, partial [Deltaproteobacteria bacterium]|nr:cyclic beta 1-2 glucan synthetase [Deltaproteobacteria bacterium]